MAAAKKKAAKKSAKKDTTKKSDAGTVAHTGLAAELIAAAGKAPGGFAEVAGEQFPAFAVRLCETLAKVPDEDFNKISDAGRKWFDDAVEPINKKKYDDIALLDGFPAPAAAANDKPADAPDAPKTPKSDTKDAPKPDAKKDEPKTPKEKKAPKPAKAPRGPRVGLVIAEMIAKNPRLTYEKLCERLDVKTKKIAHEEGSYIHSRWEEAVHCMKVAAEK